MHACMHALRIYTTYVWEALTHSGRDLSSSIVSSSGTCGDGPIQGRIDHGGMHYFEVVAKLARMWQKVFDLVDGFKRVNEICSRLYINITLERMCFNLFWGPGSFL